MRLLKLAVSACVSRTCSALSYVISLAAHSLAACYNSLKVHLHFSSTRRQLTVDRPNGGVAGLAIWILLEFLSPWCTPVWTLLGTCWSMHGSMLWPLFTVVLPLVAELHTNPHFPIERTCNVYSCQSRDTRRCSAAEPLQTLCVCTLACADAFPLAQRTRQSLQSEQLECTPTPAHSDMQTADRLIAVRLSVARLENTLSHLALPSGCPCRSLEVVQLPNARLCSASRNIHVYSRESSFSTFSDM